MSPLIQVEDELLLSVSHSDIHICICGRTITDKINSLAPKSKTNPNSNFNSKTES